MSLCVGVDQHTMCSGVQRPVGVFFFFKQKTAYEMRISDWSSDVCSSDLKEFAPNNGKRILDHLKLLGGDYGGFPVDRLEHCLQTATRAHRDGRDEEYVVMALLHDIGDTLGAFNHPDVAAAILKPFLSEENLLIVQHHGIFQGQIGRAHV